VVEMFVEGVVELELAAEDEVAAVEVVVGELLELQAVVARPRTATVSMAITAPGGRRSQPRRRGEDG
jgi:hypothetical protein